MSAAESDTRIVVTGLGVLASLGSDVNSFWDSLIAGRSGIGPVTRFDSTDIASKVASEVRDWDPATEMDPKEVRRNDRYVHLALAAARRAMTDAGLSKEDLEPERTGVLVGSGIGGLETVESQLGVLFKKGPRRVSPFMIPSLIANIAGGVIAIELGAKGPNFAIVSACASGSHAIGEALRMMRSGLADVMLAGGSEACVTRIGFAGFCSMKAMSTRYNDDPVRASRPFDAGRDGFVMGEGAGVLVLETLEHAKARGATIYAELAGYAATCDAYHITSPDLEAKALTRCMHLSLGDARQAPEDIAYVNAHGTSTPYNDRSETLALKNVFGAHAKNGLAISSTKSMTVPLLGAAGAIEAATVCKAIENNIAPPTINYEEPDPECDLDYVPGDAREIPIRNALCNSLGFGGHNVSIAVGQLD
jgi:3-oxoacyl-[acyl-carrier-protein] synthase II